MEDRDLRPVPIAPLSTHPAPASDELVLAHMPLVRSIAARLYRLRWNGAVGFDEYCQMGALGLVEAAQRFDPARGAPFGSFASWRISGAILDGLTHSTEQHQQMASRKQMIDSRVEALASQDATPQEMSIDATLARIAKLAVGLAVGFMLENTGMFDDGQAVSSVDGYASIAQRQLGVRLRQTVAHLPDQERRVLERHYFQQQPFVQIAADLGLTRGRISQIHKRALDTLRAALAPDHTEFEA